MFICKDFAGNCCKFFFKRAGLDAELIGQYFRIQLPVFVRNWLFECKIYKNFEVIINVQCEVKVH